MFFSNPAPRRRRLASLLAVALMGAAITLPGAPAATATTVTDAARSAAESSFINALNARRTKLGLVPVRSDYRLKAIARAKSDDMIARGYFAQTSPDGQTLVTLLDQAPIARYAAAEVIVRNTASIDTTGAVGNGQVWASSTRAAIAASKSYNYIGVGLSIDPTTGENIWTAIFIKGPDRTGARAVAKPILLGGWKTSTSRAVTIAWSGYDPKLQVLTSGLRAYTVQRKVDSGSWVTLASTTTTTSRTFTAYKGHRYEFRITARDNAGNRGAYVTIVVNIGSAPAPTPPPSTSGGVVATYGPTLTASTLRTAINNMNIDVIELKSGTYHLGAAVNIDKDRTSRPLTIRPAAGATVVFAGAGSATEYGQFFFGLNTRARYITMTGFTFDGYLLAQAGIFEIRQTDHVTINNMTFRHITRDTARSDRAFKTWAAYISRSNSHFNASGWNMVGTSRTWSGIQIDSGTTASAIHLKNMTASSLAYAFYENVPTTDLLLDNWSITNSTQGDVSISFHQSHGTYRNIHGTNSGVVGENNSWMVSGGGNSFN